MKGIALPLVRLARWRRSSTVIVLRRLHVESMLLIFHISEGILLDLFRQVFASTSPLRRRRMKGWMRRRSRSLLLFVVHLFDRLGEKLAEVTLTRQVTWQDNIKKSAQLFEVIFERCAAKAEHHRGLDLCERLVRLTVVVLCDLHLIENGEVKTEATQVSIPTAQDAVGGEENVVALFKLLDFRLLP